MLPGVLLRLAFQVRDWATFLCKTTVGSYYPTNKEKTLMTKKNLMVPAKDSVNRLTIEPIWDL
jgi:hypothetical protein